MLLPQLFILPINLTLVSILSTAGDIKIKLLTREDILSLKSAPIRVRIDDNEELELRVLSLTDADALARRLDLSAVKPD